MTGSETPQKYKSRISDLTGESGFSSDDQGAEDCGCWGFLRGTRDRAVMLELRKKDGSIRAVGYSWIEAVDFDIDNGIALYYRDAVIRIKGRNLTVPGRQQTSLLGALIRHRVPWIVESDQKATLQADKDIVVIEAIEW